MSNIRNRKIEEEEDIVPDYMQNPMPNRWGLGRFTPEEEAEMWGPKTPERKDRKGFSEDPLWMKFRIKPGTSLTKKVEILMLRYRMTDGEILETLSGESEEAVTAELIKLNHSIRQLGRNLTPEEREIERGRTIARLEITLAEIEYVLTELPTDSRLMSQKASILKELTTLRGLASASKDAADSSNEETLEVMLSRLSAEKLLQLSDKLQALKS